MLRCLKVMCTLDMGHPNLSSSASSKGREILSPRHRLRDTYMGAQFDKLKMIWTICEFLLVIVQQVSLHFVIKRDFLFVVDNSLGNTMVSELF